MDHMHNYSIHAARYDDDNIGKDDQIYRDSSSEQFASPIVDHHLYQRIEAAQFSNEKKKRDSEFAKHTGNNQHIYDDKDCGYIGNNIFENTKYSPHLSNFDISLFDKSQNKDNKLLSSSGTTPSASMPIRKLFDNSRFHENEHKEDNELSKLSEGFKNNKFKESSKDEREDISLTLSQSPDSYACTANDMSKSQQKVINFYQGLETNKYKVKRISQGSPNFVQNNRYGYQYEAEKSLKSGSLGDKLLENSKLISEDEMTSPAKPKHLK